MAGRSQRHLREEQGQDSSEWNGTPYYVNATPADMNLAYPATADATVRVETQDVVTASATVTGSSIDTSVATVTASADTDVGGDATLTVTSVGEGTTTVVFTHEGVASSVDVVVTEPFKIAAAPATSAITHPNTEDITVTYTNGGSPVESGTVSAATDDAGVATVEASDTTNASGEAVLTITSVAAGTCNITFSATDAVDVVVPVTVS